MTRKESVRAHIVAEWAGGVVGGSGRIPKILIRDPKEDATKDTDDPTQYPEIIVIENEQPVTLDWYSQRSKRNVEWLFPISVRLERVPGYKNTKTTFDNICTELERIFAMQITGFDGGNKYEGPFNLTQTKGRSGSGFYQANYILHLFQWGTATGASWGAGGQTGASLWDAPVVLWAASDLFSAERLCQLTATDTLADWTVTGTLKAGDPADYLSLTTVSGVPKIGIVGGHYMRIGSDHGVSNMIRLEGVDASTYVDLLCSKGAGHLTIFSVGNILFMTGGDNDDYWYFSTAANVASLLPVEDKVHNIGSAILSADHVYSDDFDNTSPFHRFSDPVAAIKAIGSKTVEGEETLDYESLPDFVRTHTRDPKRHKWGKEMREDPETGEQVEKDVIVERAPKDIIAQEGWSINRMCLLLYQALQKAVERIEVLEAA